MNRLTEKHKNKNNEIIYLLLGEDCDIVIDKFGQLEDIEEEFLNYNIDMTSFLKQVLDELKQQPTLEIKNFNPAFKILRDDFIKLLKNKNKNNKNLNEGD